MAKAEASAPKHKSIDEIKKKIFEATPMRRLPQEDFAEEYGLADSLAVALGRNLNATQLRKVFDEIKRVRRKLEDNFDLKVDRDKPFDRAPLLRLMPLLAFAVGRKLLPREFYDILKHCLGRQQLVTNADFLQTAYFIEAVLAFHKYQSTMGQKGQS